MKLRGNAQSRMVSRSLIINKAAIERGLFDGCKFTFYKAEFLQKEELGNPDASKTENPKSANYDKLVNGIVQKGQRIEKDDVLIGAYMPIPKGKDDKYVYIDRSIVYKEHEDAIVHNVIKDQNEDENPFVKVSLRKVRPVCVGDKMSSRSGQKGIGALLMQEADMMTTQDGIRPDIIFNPCGIPSRMTVAQLIESLLGILCAIKGSFYDATIFKPVDIESIADELEKFGFNKYGYQRMINGMTGEFIDTLVFFGPTFYQRLQKFVADAEYSVRHALTDAITMQCLDGAGSGGGLKIGEMEKDTLVCHGVSRFLREKFYDHSDGYNMPMCRCGEEAIVNHKENIYKCRVCGDNADIVIVPSSWTSKLFFHEMGTTNVGTKRIPRPFTYPIADTPDRRYSAIDKYDGSIVKQLMSMAEEMVDDASVSVDATD